VAQLQQRVEDCVRCHAFLRRLNDGCLRERGYYSPKVCSTKQWAAARSLAGRIDMDRVVLAGHSMGGSTAIKALSHESGIFK
jgi:predicted alpha/beta hydrolase family esterase